MEFKESILVEREDVAEQLLPGQLATLHCKHCHTVLGDSLSVCGELPFLESVICLKVTNDVVVSDEMDLGRNGKLAECIFSHLTCRKCGRALGKALLATPPHLAALRSLFLLRKAQVTCYVLGSCAMVKASAVSFRLESLAEDIHEVEQKFQAHLHAMKKWQADSINSLDK
ncbi:protein Mis18-beta [Stigmatopora argus]